MNRKNRKIFFIINDRVNKYDKIVEMNYYQKIGEVILVFHGYVVLRETFMHPPFVD